MKIQPLEGTRVLILEDEFLIAIDIEQLCRDHGATECTIVRNLADAGEASGFDVAIVDLRLGDGSTLDYARNLRRRGIPFIFATGYSDLEQVESEFPGVAVVEKPYDSGKLINALVAALKRPVESAGGC